MKPKFIPIPARIAMLQLLGMYLGWESFGIRGFYSDIERTKLVAIQIGPRFWRKIK